MAKKLTKKLTKKQNNAVIAAALLNASKRVAALGTEPLEKGSYSFDFTPEIVGELDVKAGKPAGDDKTVCDLSAADLIIAMHATCDSFGSLVSDAMGWQKKASKEQIAEHKAGSQDSIMRVAKRRKMTTVKASPATAGAKSSKPRVNIKGASVDSRVVTVEVKS